MHLMFQPGEVEDTKSHISIVTHSYNYFFQILFSFWFKIINIQFKITILTNFARKIIIIKP